MKEVEPHTEDEQKLIDHRLALLLGHDGECICTSVLSDNIMSFCSRCIDICPTYLQQDIHVCRLTGERHPWSVEAYERNHSS
jgi:hypothetical protein